MEVRAAGFFGSVAIQNSDHAGVRGVGLPDFSFVAT